MRVRGLKHNAKAHSVKVQNENSDKVRFVPG